ncbi:WD40 repeat domain-containing protein [Microcoleus sp. Pol12B4]|uniref:WD40 repeat domain-containing protein n=1 Tax=Microcoleus sp. Pol12B4 TaxID=3055395 RepID=UPI002FCF6393
MGDFKQQLGKMSRQKRLDTLETLPRHLVESAAWERLYQLLTDFDFIEAKLEELGVQTLIEDYDLPINSNMWLSQEQSETLKLIQGAIRESAHILIHDKTQLAGQLLGRLLDIEIAELQGMLEQVKQWKDSPWLRPLRANFWPPGQGCVRFITGHRLWVLGVAIAPDGLTAISASWDKSLRIWDTETGRELQTLIGHTKPVLGVAIAPEGKRAISASLDCTLKIWDTETGRELRTLTGHTRGVNAVAIAPDGLTAISASQDETLKTWDLLSGTELTTLTGHTDKVTAVAIAPDGRTAISTSQDRTLKIWDTETGRELIALTGHTDKVTAVAIAPDGRTAISASRDRTLKIWDTNSGRELRTLTGHSGGVNAVAIAPNGLIAVSGSLDRTLKIWDLLSGKEIASFSGGSVFGCAIAPDGVTVVAGDRSGRVHFLRLEGVSGGG